MVLLFYTDHYNRVHHSEEVLRSFTMAPCVFIEKLEGKQRFSRAPVGRHAGRQSPRKTKVTVHEKRKVNEELGNQIPQQLSHHHDSAAPRQQPLVYTGPEPIHPVHGPPKLLAMEAIPQNEVTLVPFSRVLPIEPPANLDIFL